MRPPVLLALLLATAAAPAADRIPAATPVGPARDCVPISQIRETRVRNDRIVDFMMAGGMVDRNTLPYACPGLGSERRFSYATSLSVLCSTDIITIFSDTPPMRGASCGLGAFQPVRLAK